MAALACASRLTISPRPIVLHPADGRCLPNGRRQARASPASTTSPSRPRERHFLPSVSRSHPPTHPPRLPSVYHRSLTRYLSIRSAPQLRVAPRAQAPGRRRLTWYAPHPNKRPHPTTPLEIATHCSGLYSRIAAYEFAKKVRRRLQLYGMPHMNHSPIPAHACLSYLFRIDNVQFPGYTSQVRPRPPMTLCPATVSRGCLRSHVRTARFPRTEPLREGRPRVRGRPSAQSRATTHPVSGIDSRLSLASFAGCRSAALCLSPPTIPSCQPSARTPSEFHARARARLLEVAPCSPSMVAVLAHSKLQMGEISMMPEYAYLPVCSRYLLRLAALFCAT